MRILNIQDIVYFNLISHSKNILPNELCGAHVFITLYTFRNRLYVENNLKEMSIIFTYL